jgi:hypothetical protein
LGLFPVAFYHYYKTSIKQTAIIVSGIIISSILFYFIKHDIREFWLGPEIDIMNFHFDTILTFPEKLFHHLTGSYYYNEIMQYSIFTMLWSVLFEVLIVGLIITAFVRIIAKKHYLLFYIFTVSVILTIGFLFIENEETPRYLLPLTGCVLYMFYSFSIISNYKIIIYILTGSLIILGSIAIFYTNNDCKIADRKNIIHLTDELQSNNIHYVYCKDGLLQWQIMFYSNEKVIARYTGSSDRYPEYIKTVDKGREKDCDNTAIVGYYYPEIKQQYEDVIILDEKFYIFKSPGKGLLIDQGFEMTEN